jgi:hypothetical protein
MRKHVFGVVVLCVAVAFLAGCQNTFSRSSQGSNLSSNEGNILVQGTREEVPEFERTYTVDLPKNRMMVITIHSNTFSNTDWDRDKSGKIEQLNGDWIWFDPDAPGDNITDRDIVPLVIKYCKQIDQQDKQWRSTKPDHYTDQSGAVWVRQ